MRQHRVAVSQLATHVNKAIFRNLSQNLDAFYIIHVHVSREVMNV